jgi:hypothetical protein
MKVPQYAPQMPLSQEPRNTHVEKFTAAVAGGSGILFY